MYIAPKIRIASDEPSVAKTTHLKLKSNIKFGRSLNLVHDLLADEIVGYLGIGPLYVNFLQDFSERFILFLHALNSLLSKFGRHWDDGRTRGTLFPPPGTRRRRAVRAVRALIPHQLHGRFLESENIHTYIKQDLVLGGLNNVTTT